jgi:hypothetical protein
MPSDKFVYSYKGINYFYEKDYEEDNIKIFHLIKSDSISLDSFPLSPYSHVSYSMFCKWVDMGMPSREQMGGHHHSDHEKYYNKWLNNQIDKMLVEEMTDAL